MPLPAPPAAAVRRARGSAPPASPRSRRDAARRHLLPGLRLVEMLMSLCALHLFRPPAEDSSGSQAFQKCRAASITRALLPAMPANLRGRPGLDWRWGWGPGHLQGLGVAPPRQWCCDHTPPSAPAFWGPSQFTGQVHASDPGGWPGDRCSGRR